jgi:hypothetical protein
MVITRRPLLLITTLLFLMTVITTTKLAGSLLTPGLVTIEPARYDLGEVIYGEVRELEFQVTNSTQDEVVITRLSTSCGCTTAKIDVESLSPGSTASLLVVFDPAVHPDAGSTDEAVRTVYLETDHPNFPLVMVEISVTVVSASLAD